VFLFTASAWPGQVLSGADRRDREGQVPEEEQVRREPAPRSPLEGAYRPGLMERLRIGSKMAASKTMNRDVTRVQGSSHSSQVAVNKWLTFKYEQIPRCVAHALLLDVRS
jgi:hypothetical protein